MADTYKALQSVTVGAGGTAFVEFTNIPQTYTDLVIKISSLDSNNANFGPVRVFFNGVNANLSLKAIYGYNSGVGSENLAQNRIGYTSAAGAVGSPWGSGELYIPNYGANAAVKLSSAIGCSEIANNTLAVTSFNGNLYSSNNVITSIKVSPDVQNWAQNTMLTLYGVFNSDVSAPPATPTIGTATGGDQSASITFTGVSGAASYTMTSSPGSFTATGTTSPITVSGLTNGTSYTFTVTASNPFGTSGSSAASNSVTPAAVAIPLLGAWTTAATTIPSAGADSYYGVSLVGGEPRVFGFGSSRSDISYYNNGLGGTWTQSGSARPAAQGLGSSSKSMTNSGLFYTYGGDTGTQNLVYSTQTGSSWTAQNNISYNAGWSDGCYFTQSGNFYLIAAADYPSGTPAARATVNSNGTLNWGSITSYPVYAAAPRFARLTSVAVGMGGFTSTSLSASRSDVYSYNAATNSWTSQTSLPFTPNGGYIPAFSLTGGADSRVYVSQASGTALWSRGDSSGTWRSETAVPSAWAYGWGTVTSSGTLRVQVSNASSTHFQTVA